MTAVACPVNHAEMFASPVPYQDARPYKQMPKDLGWPLLGRTLDTFYRPTEFYRENYAKFGPVWRTRLLTWDVVIACGPDAGQSVLMNRDKVFSNKEGWEVPVGKLFGGGLMIRDFEEHREHRLIMQQAFNREPMRQYTIQMNPDMDRYLDHWIPGYRNEAVIPFYPKIKATLLRLAVPTFTGEHAGRTSRKLNKAMTDLVNATGAFLRFDIPGSKYGRGLAARRYLERYFGDRIEARRNGTGQDMFSQMCRAESEEGKRFTRKEIIDHMIFLIFAAHDTNTIANTTLFYQLARNTRLQQQLREESRALDKQYLEHDDLAELKGIELVFKEALRWQPPVPTLFRRTVKDTVMGGYQVPAGTLVNVVPQHTHNMPELWQCPATFDPERFTEDRAEDKVHKFAYYPFGGGVHKCLGRHFAENQTKALLHQALLKYKWELANEGALLDMEYSSMPKPKDKLPIRFTRLG